MDNSSYQKWLRFAKDDLLWTDANIREKIWYGACFTAQQAAEKVLKAYLIKQGKIIRKIHDLGALLEICIQEDKTFEVLREACATLTDYYAPTRYPDVAEFVDFTEEKAKEAYSLVKKIVSFVEEKLNL